MKKSVSSLFAILTMMMIVSGNSASTASTFATTPPHKGIDYSQELARQQEHLWNLGKDLTIGDSYTYQICDPDAILNYSAERYHYFTKNLEHNGSLCYTIQMDFVNLIATDQNQINGLIWVVQAQITDDFTGNTRHSVFHVDSESFEVRSADTIHPDSIRYAKSLQNTIFTIHKYTAQESKLLQENIIWGEVTEYNERGNNPDMKVMAQTTFDASSYPYEILKQNTVTETKQLDVFAVGYQIDISDESYIARETNQEDEDQDNNNVTNYFLVSSHLPFPVSGEFFNPSYILEPHKEFEFELLKYLETKSNRPPLPILIPATNDHDNDTEDASITITGTIELTFPDDVISDDVVVPDDITPDDVIPDDTTADDIAIDNITTDDVSSDNVDSDDVISDDVVTDDIATNNIQGNTTLSVIVILGIVLGVVGFVIWKRPSFVWKGKNKNKQNITKTKISFDDKINLEIQTISDSGAKL